MKVTFAHLYIFYFMLYHIEVSDIYVSQLERKKPSIPKPVSQTETKPSPFHNLPNPQVLAQLNSHLQSNSYVSGWAASQDDLVVHSLVPKAVLNSFPHVKRWYFHILAIADTIEVCLPCNNGMHNPVCSMSYWQPYIPLLL